MTREEAYRSIVQDVATLLKRSAGPGGKLTLSPENAERIRALPGGADAPAPQAADVVEGAAEAARPQEANTLEALAAQVRPCTRCGLATTRTQTVFGVGNPRADLVFVGEAPGEEEDRQGEPFVGRAGQLLTDIIVKGMKMRREDVYICNVLKCRPPGNRDPLPDEVMHCEPFLLRQLDLIQPKVICALGHHAAKTLLRTEESTSRLRSRWHNYHGIPLRVTYHPAYLLRKPGEKKKTWEDIQEVLKVLHGEVVPEV